MSDYKINPNAAVNDGNINPESKAATAKPTTIPKPPAPPKTTLPARMSKSAQIQPSCENCKLLLHRLALVEARLRKFTDKQRGERQRSKRISKLLANSDMVFALREKGISNRKQAALWECSEISIRRLLDGTLTNDNP